MTDDSAAPRFMLVLRSIAFWLVFATSIPLFAVILLLTFPFPVETRFAIVDLWTRIALRWLEITCRLGYRVQGLENIPSQPCIVFSKHQSTWETLALNYWFKPPAWVLKRELLWIPFFGWGAYLMEPIALNRSAGKQAIKQLVEQGRDRLQKNRWVVIFPEGTRVAPGQTGRYRIGGAVLAEQTGYPVVPVAHNAGEFWPRHQFVKMPGVIQVSIGAPIDTENKTAAEILNEAQTWIENEAARISARAESHNA